MPTPRGAITILGLGSLLSERSARTTFPHLRNFRCVRIRGFRRVFAHSPSIFVARKIANMETLELSSLSAEPCEGSSFIMTAFEVDDNGSGMDAFREREEEFKLSMVPCTCAHKDGDFVAHMSRLSDRSLRLCCVSAVNTDEALDGKPDPTSELGMLCEASTDDAYVQQWGQQRFDDEYTKRGLSTIWGWRQDSGLRPCGAYLRHCVLAAQRLGETAHQSFLDETFMVDRKTTIRSYLEAHPEVMDLHIEDPALRERYSG